ncbi:MAG: hypothetical protein O7F73_12800 [Gammaproteobacteria bacterium]|nr:hypothetical protein [Gammaproteobacteria bacterium]
MSEIGQRWYRWWRSARYKLDIALQGTPQHPEFVRAAHYFADGWALNMWQVMQPRQLAADLRCIADDGFNTIILVVPWRGFQVDQLQPRYDPFYVRQLHRALAAADRAGLSVIVRVAYSHQILQQNTPNGITLAQRLLIDADTQQAWLHQLAELHRHCACYRCFRGGFLCWEELWHAFGKWQLRKLQPRQKLAEITGFGAYLQSKGIAGVDAIPPAEAAAYTHYHAFVNHRIREFYQLACTAFPGLSMEFRVDKDPLQTETGIQWLSNDDYSDLVNGRFSYWAPFMGAENVGEQLDAEQAAHLLEYMLGEITAQGHSINHVVDQFNFVDEAPKFKGIHAEIQPHQVAPFLALAAPLLRKFSRGYGVWAHRDYRQNVLYNPRFLMGMRGWEVVRGSCKTRRRGGARLGSAALLRQVLPPVIAGLQRAVFFDSLILRVEVQTRQAAPQLRMRINAGPWFPLQEAPDNALSVEVPVDYDMVLDEGLILELENQGAALVISTLYLYHYVFRGGIRSEDGRPAQHHRALLEFNSRLAGAACGDTKD